MGKIKLFKGIIYTIIFALFPLTLAALTASSVVFHALIKDQNEEIRGLRSEVERLTSIVDGMKDAPEDDPSDTEARKATAPFRKWFLNIHSVMDPGSGEDKPVPETIANDMTFEICPDFKQDITLQNGIETGKAYLTFDDGPSVYTNEILDILNEYEVKATFFVINTKIENYDIILKRIVDEGHTLGMHSASHIYEKIYKSVNAFVSDLNNNFTYIWEATGIKPQIMRFAGGSINSYNSGIASDLIKNISERGFVYYDWNVSTGDTSLPRPDSDRIVRNVLDNINGRDRIIILAHDTITKGETVKALPRIIAGVREAGFEFDRLTPDIPLMSLKSRK